MHSDPKKLDVILTGTLVVICQLFSVYGKCGIHTHILWCIIHFWIFWKSCVFQIFKHRLGALKPRSAYLSVRMSVCRYSKNYKQLQNFKNTMPELPLLLNAILDWKEVKEIFLFNYLNGNRLQLCHSSGQFWLQLSSSDLLYNLYIQNTKISLWEVTLSLSLFVCSFWFQGSFKCVTIKFHKVSQMFQGSLNGFKTSKGRFKVVSTVFQYCFKTLSSGVAKWSFNGISRKLPWCFKSVSSFLKMLDTRMFHEQTSFKQVSTKFK